MSEHEAKKQVTVWVNGTPLSCAAGLNLLSVVGNANMVIATACAGKGNCHLCRLTVVSSNTKLPPPTDAERRGLGNILLAQGMRLACQIGAVDNLRVKLPVYETPEQRRQRIRQARAAASATDKGSQQK